VPAADLTTYAHIRARASAVGLAVRGAFCPERGELTPYPPGFDAGTLILIGFTGSRQWPDFARSAEARDGLPHPLDRWSRRLIGALAAEFGARDLYPSATPPLPFQRFAARAEPLHQSPIGLLIHPQWGLWHAYRGALLLPERIALPGAVPSASPCASCAGRPCLAACPVQAFRDGSFDLEACVRHVGSEAGGDCREQGCRARRACPVGADYRYEERQARFHMRAFLRSVPP